MRFFTTNTNCCEAVSVGTTVYAGEFGNATTWILLTDHGTVSVMALTVDVAYSDAAYDAEASSVAVFCAFVLMRMTCVASPGGSVPRSVAS